MSDRSPFARFALGVAAGISIGYTAVRVRDMLADQLLASLALHPKPKETISII